MVDRATKDTADEAVDALRWMRQDAQDLRRDLVNLGKYQAAFHVREAMQSLQKAVGAVRES